MFFDHCSGFPNSNGMSISKNTNNTIDVLSSVNNQNTVNTVIQNKNESNVEVSYNRDNVNCVFTIPERSIVTVVDDI